MKEIIRSLGTTDPQLVGGRRCLAPSSPRDLCVPCEPWMRPPGVTLRWSGCTPAACKRSWRRRWLIRRPLQPALCKLACACVQHHPCFSRRGGRVIGWTEYLVPPAPRDLCLFCLLWLRPRGHATVVRVDTGRVQERLASTAVGAVQDHASGRAGRGGGDQYGLAKGIDGGRGRYKMSNAMRNARTFSGNFRKQHH